MKNTGSWATLAELVKVIKYKHIPIHIYKFPFFCTILINCFYVISIWPSFTYEFAGFLIRRNEQFEIMKNELIKPLPTHTHTSTCILHTSYVRSQSHIKHTAHLPPPHIHTKTHYRSTNKANCGYKHWWTCTMCDWEWRRGFGCLFVTSMMYPLDR